MSKDKIIAKVDKLEIHQSDVESLKNMLGKQGEIFKGNEGIKALREELIHQEILYRDALKKDLEKEETFQKALEHTKRQMLQQYALKKLISGVSVSESEAEEYYKKNKEKIDGAFVSEDPEAKPEFNRIKGQIIQQLTLMKQQEKYTEYLKSIEKEYDIKRYELKEDKHE